jgi:hypothetical protein
MVPEYVKLFQGRLLKNHRKTHCLSLRNLIGKLTESGLSGEKLGW